MIVRVPVKLDKEAPRRASAVDDAASVEEDLTDDEGDAAPAAAMDSVRAVYHDFHGEISSARYRIN